MSKMRVIGVVIVVLSVTLSDRVSERRRVVQIIPDSLACPECSITVKPVATLGTASGPARIGQLPRSVARDNHDRYWVLVNGSPLVFDRTGTYLRGLAGGALGPGGFKMPTKAVPVVGDSMVVLDPLGSQAVVVGPDLRPARKLGLSFTAYGMVPTQWPLRAVVDGLIPTPEAAGWPLHRVSFSASSVQALRSFGPESGYLLVGGETALGTQLCQADSGGRYWSAEISQYRLTLWGANDEKVRSLSRSPAWFRGKFEASMGGPSTPPQPRITAMEVDSAGLIWVFATLPSDHWRQAWAGISLGRGIVDLPAGRIKPELLFHTMIELIDPKLGRVITRRLLDGWIIAALPGRQAAAYSVEPSGERHVSIVALEVLRD
jgi:hypothetical protein